MNIGRCRRSLSARRTSASEITWPGRAVEAMTTSACGRCAASASSRITEAGKPSAMRSARFVLRFAMIMRPIFCACRWRAVSSIISPAPTSSAVCRSKPENTRRASWMPAEATETALAPIAVSVRTRLATAKVDWNRRLSRAPEVPACCAAR